MNNAAALYGVVDLDNVRQNNMVYIDLGKQLQESIFERQYKMAARLVGDIITECDKQLCDDLNACVKCTRTKCDDCIHYEKKRYQPRLHTAVPFIGDRGTGKTSVMRSIMDRLRTYDGNNPNAAFYLGGDLKQACFITLDMIDCGMIRKTEDVMEIILAQMLSYLENLNDDEQFLDLYRQIDKLHKDLCHIGEDDDREPDEFGLTNLQHVADSRNAVSKFQKLIREFLAVMSRCQFNGRRCYLVIALDDVDMYQGSKWGMENTQFALLEHIYCHLRIPGLIVLMTFNEHLLKRACNRHFEDIYFGRRLTREYTPTEKADIEGLTAQFLSKLFPQERRVYMPNYMLVDALDHPNLYIKPKLGGEWLAPFGSDDAVLPVKDFMLRLIAHKTGVYFDAAGTKKHFFEPRNLRELGELFQFVNSMEDVSPESGGQEAVRAGNRQRLLDYLQNQYALRHLDAEEYQEFAGLLALPLHRQDRTLIDKIRLQRQKITSSPDDFGYLAGHQEDRWRYSYGELLHNIYFSTRISKNKDSEEPYLRKEFMRCIFGTHSVQLNEAVSSAQSREDMLKIIGSSLAGRWANKMLPQLSLLGCAETSGAGSISLPVRDFFGWQIPDLTQKAIEMLCHGEVLKSKTALMQFMEALVVAGMFFTNVPGRGLGIRLDVDAGSDGNPALFLCSDYSEQICFNVLNFAINLYDALPEGEDRAGYLSSIRRKLETLGERFIEDMGSDWAGRYGQAEIKLHKLKQELSAANTLILAPDVYESIKIRVDLAEQELEQIMRWGKLQEAYRDGFKAETFRGAWNTAVHKVIEKYQKAISAWRAKFGTYQWVLPVQNFDMMYNINKRLGNVSYYDIPDDTDVDDIFEYYVGLYKSLVSELESQDKVYFKGQSGRFAAPLKECIFYTAITASPRMASGKLNKQYNPAIEEVLVSMAAATVRPNSTRTKHLRFATDDL